MTTRYQPQNVELPGDLVTQQQLVEARPFTDVRTIRHFRETGRLTGYRFGRKVLVSLSDFDALIQREEPPH